jgi:hypothetical protein
VSVSAVMKGIRSFIGGFGIRNVKPAAFGWIFNFAFALAVFYGVGKLLSYAFGETLLAESITSVGLFTVVSEVVRHCADGVWVIASLGFFSVGLFWIVSIFLSGGVYGVLVFGEQESFRNLISSAIENFFKMAVVFLVNIVVWLAAGFLSILALLGLFKLHSALFTRFSLDPFIWAWVGLATVFLLFASAVHDFSKIFRLRGEKNSLKSFARAIRFVSTHKLIVALLSLLYLASTGVILLVYGLLLGSRERAAAVPVVALFGVYEIVIYSRYYLKTVLIRAWIGIDPSNRHEGPCE